MGLLFALQVEQNKWLSRGLTICTEYQMCFGHAVKKTLHWLRLFPKLFPSFAHNGMLEVWCLQEARIQPLRTEQNDCCLFLN